jgi:hypothetical protein
MDRDEMIRKKMHELAEAIGLPLVYKTLPRLDLSLKEMSMGVPGTA